MGWPKGTSGNPGGRPKTRVDLQALCRARTPEAVATLIRMMRQKTNPAAAARAAEILLDRGWGRAESSGSLTFRVPGEDGAVQNILVSFVTPQPPPDDPPRMLPDLRSPHLPGGTRRNN